ncbi:hypothetical protein [Lentzea sp. NPDC055074]
MSRESGSDQTQRTVAELLAQYGGSAESAPRRRRRRAADEEDEVQQPETAPQTIIERVLSDSGRLMAIRDDAAPPAGRRAAPEPQAAPLPPAAERTAYQPKPQVAPPKPPGQPQPSQQLPVPPAQPPQVRRPAPPKPAPPAAKPPAPVPPPPAAAEQTRQVPQVRDQPSNSGMPRPDVPGRLEARLDSSPSRTNITRPPKPVPPSVQMPVPGPPREAMTEQLPRIPAKAPVDKIAALETESVLIVPPAPPRLPDPLPGNVPDAWFGDDDPQAKTDLSMAPMESTAAHPGPYVDDDDSQEYAAYRAEDDYLADTDEEDDEDDDGPAGLDDAAEVEEDADAEPRSAGKEWLIMIGQLAVGVLGGAGLWLAFNYLWRSVPAAALVVALAVTVGLVLLVRKIRRADDLQTTVLAVLVGLIVTVSPAAMLLVKS